MNGYKMSPDSSTSPRAYVQTGVPQSFTIDGFRLNKSDLLPDHIKALNNLAKLIADTHQTQQPVLEIVFVGFADTSGTFTYNHYLGLKRACSAATHLLYVLHDKYRAQLKFPVPVTLNTEGKLTLVSADRPEKNRRVEIWLRAELPRRGYPPHGHNRGGSQQGPYQQHETVLDEIMQNL
ncbi:MAG: hypothetical protein ACKVU2_01475 [Saprospiraceae bacterium]